MLGSACPKSHQLAHLAVGSPARAHGDAILRWRGSNAGGNLAVHIDVGQVGRARPLERVWCALVLIRVRRLVVQRIEDPLHVVLCGAMREVVVGELAGLVFERNRREKPFWNLGPNRLQELQYTM